MTLIQSKFLILHTYSVYYDRYHKMQLSAKVIAWRYKMKTLYDTYMVIGYKIRRYIPFS